MELLISDLLPDYFDKKRKDDSEIWGKDLRFGPGELISIVAPSGSGKSSLINFLYGMKNEYSGNISYAGAQMHGMSLENKSAIRRDHLSIVFQDLRLFHSQTVRENALLKLQLNPHHPESKIDEMASRLGIDHKLNSLCATCSYGEQQRTAILRALMQPFDYLLLDEPFSHLDNNNSKKALDLILEEAQARKATVILADLELVPHYPYTRLFHL